MATVLALTPAEQPPARADAPGPDINGGWLIVYAEEKGRRIQKWEQSKVTAKDGALTYERDGKDFTITLKFGPHQTVKATTGGKDEAANGVCIVGQDYLCLSLSGGAFKGVKEDKDKPKIEDPKGSHSSSDFILILRRQRDK
jgi:hypothetical protein